ncbi:right-handed parallel beta-helix repeat-containing protein [Candidatus Dojkabacteria bacterium]|uniref:Probable pectate lyase C n=1 Tax=Candidatus Dojkabacteria bacterium TaxID=2099670 RepID=A0A955L0M9_9BACT|nr:right-handed parallel beta-helix repeat-containing protein [Candidatus Dojkabacteria bacterium]
MYKKFLLLVSIIGLLGLLYYLGNRTKTNYTNVASESIVVISKNDIDIQSIIDSNSPGTTYLFETGLHRLIDQIIPQEGDIFMGEEGAVLSGSVLLNNPSTESNLYYYSNQIDNPEIHGSCDPQYPRCSYNHELFIDDVRQRHVSSKSEVEVGSWFFDYDNDRIYIGENPNGKKVEVSKTSYAFVPKFTTSTNTNNNVTIKDLTFEKFSNWAQRGVIKSAHAGTQYTVTNGWVIENNEFINNHGPAVSFNSNWIVRNNLIHYSGQMGLGGSGDNAIVQGNEIAYNNQAYFSCQWECGGAKFARTNNLVVDGNYVHHNLGPGLWTDIDNINTLYKNNTVVNNNLEGIKHEISFDVEIKDNFVAYNGDTFNTWLWGAQINIQNSRNAYVHNNILITTSGDGLGVINQSRGYSSTFPLNSCDTSTTQSRESTCLPLIGINNRFENNIVYSIAESGDIGSIAKDTAEITEAEFYESNSFDYNTYYVPDVSRNRWGAYNKGNSFAAFQLYGYEAHGQATSDISTIPTVPIWTGKVGPQYTDNNDTNGGTSGGVVQTEGSCTYMDSNNNGEIDDTDFREFRDKYRTVCNSNNLTTDRCGSIDSDGDGNVTLKDFIIFSSKYGKSCL